MEQMKIADFARTVTNLPAEQQNEFFRKLKTELSEEDYNTTVQFISIFGLITNPAKYKAARSAICEQLFGIEVPFKVKAPWEH
jgi:hypothetical protein